MPRGAFKGRVFPQFYSTDRRYARLSVKALVLFPLMWANADDQGRLPGDPEEIKYTCCPSIDHIPKTEVAPLLDELAQHGLIQCYTTSKTAAIQMLDWWSVHRKLQWAWPSDYPPPDGWVDHLRYKKDAKTVVTLNWPVSGETPKGSQVSEENGSGEELAEPDEAAGDSSSEENSSRAGASSPPPLPDKEEGKGRRRRNSPETVLGAQVRPHPSPSYFSTDRNRISSVLVEQFQHCFGHYKAPDLKTFYPREPDGKEWAQLRDLAEELVNAGGVPLGWIRSAFEEAAGQNEESKRGVSYVRAILCDWLQIPKARPP